MPAIFNRHCLGLLGLLATGVFIPSKASAEEPSAAREEPSAKPPAAETAEDVDDLDLLKLLNLKVSTASKASESLDDAPAVITVVTRADIQRWGYRSVAEVLSHTVGFFLLDDHILPNAGVRGVTGGLGAESNIIKVMIDGRSVAYRTTSGNWLGVELVPLGSVQQIEIIRGPASALYGADAFLGVVNIITVKPEDARTVNIRVDGGTAGTNPGGTADAVVTAQLGSFDLLLGAAAEDADRSGLTLPEESPAPTLPSYVGGRRTALDLERRSLVLQSRVGLRGDIGHVVLSGYFSGIERGGDFAHWAQLTNDVGADGTRYGTTIGLQQLRLNLDALLQASSEMNLSLQTTYFQGGLLDSDRVEVGSDLFYVERDQSYHGVDTTAEWRWTPSQKFNTIVGVEALADEEDLGPPQRIDRATGQPLAVNERNPAITLTNVGSFVSANYQVIDQWLKLTGGARYDRHSQYGGQVTGRVGATSRLSRSLVAKLLYGSAFKAPSPYLLYAEPLRPGDVVGNENLAPQLIHTAEYQMSYKPTRFFGLTSGVSYSWLLDKAEFTPQGIQQTARNVASQRSFTWESRADFRHYDDYTAYASLELLHSTRDLGQEGFIAEQVGSENVVYPPWIARAGGTVDVPSVPSVPLELGTQLNIVGPRRASSANLVAAGGNLTFDPYVVVDLFLATRELYLIPGHESRVSLRARNLLSERGPDPGFSGFEYPLPPGEIFLQFMHTY